MAGELTESECQKIHERLDEGFSWLSGLQQMGSCGDVFVQRTVEEYRKHMAEGSDRGNGAIMEVIQDIARSLGATVVCRDTDKRFLCEIQIKKSSSLK